MFINILFYLTMEVYQYIFDYVLNQYNYKWGPAMPFQLHDFKKFILTWCLDIFSTN